MTQGQFFKRSFTGLNSEFSFSLTSCLTKAEEPSLPYYLPIAGGRIIGFIPFPRVYIYIYIYILSSTDRLFRSIRTLQCGQTRRTLEAGIETHPTLRQTKSQTARPTSVPRLAKGIFKVFIPLHCHCSQDNPDPEWYHLIGSYLWVKTNCANKMTDVKL